MTAMSRNAIKIAINLTPDGHELLREAANKLSLPVATFARFAALQHARQQLNACTETENDRFETAIRGLCALLSTRLVADAMRLPEYVIDSWTDQHALPPAEIRSTIEVLHEAALLVNRANIPGGVRAWFCTTNIAIGHTPCACFDSESAPSVLAVARRLPQPA